MLRWIQKMVTPAICTSTLVSMNVAPGSASTFPVVSRPAVRRLEVVAGRDVGIEIPAGQVEAGERLDRGVHREVARRLGGPEAAERAEARGTALRHEGVAPGQADLDRDAVPVPTQRAREV